ncbi:GtrA family protein [Microbacterium sp. NPDC056052]|uniref:GtrA family protein n=1 Tax=Microbacterium sp. NPDC056052 TaxID=3345695 RepID=UPI0035E27FF4
MTSSTRRDTGSGVASSRRSVLKYLIAGGLGFLVDFGLLALLHQVFGWSTWLAAGVAFAASFLFTYAMQRNFTFGSEAPHGWALLKYSALVAFNLLATAGIVAVVDQTPAGWAVGKVAATAVTTLWNYFAYRYWVFARPRGEEP